MLLAESAGDDGDGYGYVWQTDEEAAKSATIWILVAGIEASGMGERTGTNVAKGLEDRGTRRGCVEATCNNMQKDFRRFSSASLAATCALTPCLSPTIRLFTRYFLLDNHLALLLSVLFRCRCWCCCCCCCPSCLVSFADCCTTQSAQWHLLFWRQLLHSYGSCHFLPTPFSSSFTIPFPTLIQSRVLSIFNSLFDQGKKLSSSEY